VRELSVAVRRYVVVVGVLGMASVVGWGPSAPWSSLIEDRFLWVLAVLAIAGELTPIKIPYRGAHQDVTVSTTFVIATLFHSGPAAAAAVQLVASLLADLVARRPYYKALFNAGQYSLAVTAAALVRETMHQGDMIADGMVTNRSLLVMLAAGMTFYVTNNILTGGVIVIAQGERFSSVLRTDMLFQAATTLILLSLAPLVIAVRDESLLLVFLFVPAIAAAHRSAMVSVRRNHDALHDSLTGLPNRDYFEREASAQLRESPSASVTIAVAGLDRFSEINNTMGHEFGDRIVRLCAARLRSAIGRSGFVARVSGDEFAVTGRDGDPLVELIRSALTDPLDIDGVPFHLDASVGVASAPTDGDSATELLQHASVALDVAKQRGTPVVRYSRSVDRFDPERLTLLGELRRAIDQQEFVLHFQPKVSIADRSIVGAEALVRWNHPQLGMIAPDRFIPLVESTGLVHEFTRYVAWHAVEECRRWRNAGYEISVAINVSGRNLNDEYMARDFATVLMAHEMPAESIEIEITESAAIDDLDVASEMLNQMRDHGIRVAIDDFGTGQSSLRYLGRLPVDVVKIDKSFVLAMLIDAGAAAVVGAVIDMTRPFGIVVVAEGVESAAIWQRLEERGCDLAQGYYISRPLSAADFTAWLATAPFASVHSSRPQTVTPLRPRTSGTAAIG